MEPIKTILTEPLKNPRVVNPRELKPQEKRIPCSSLIFQEIFRSSERSLKILLSSQRFLMILKKILGDLGDFLRWRFLKILGDLGEFGRSLDILKNPG